ncbi:hypothetical protein O4215_20790 [Rhodococcus maanshanensis]|uniref:hypothetical protein n=1 Tax=Rhodococcus maanshanensis TaxID=183556 RepID=UPI0022B2C105|nr:hypothetical protein [Rhodococcus maanshanensis]MCZ4558003.1 hypothetical protein [Rhodococcus maanshanensis]
MSDIKLWTAAQAAEHCGVQPRTWHAYVYRPAKKNPAPQPVDKMYGTPVWDAAEVRAWQASRA